MKTNRDEVRLSLSEAKERDKKHWGYESPAEWARYISEHDKFVTEHGGRRCDNSVRRGWHPAPDPVAMKRVDAWPPKRTDADIERLREHLKNCKGRTDNDALEEKYGADNVKPDNVSAAAPSSPIPDGARGDDLYEPIGTMPVVGDMVVVLESDGTPYKDDDAGKPQRVKAVYEDECETDFCEMNMEWFKTMNPVAKIRNRILRRTKAATGAKYYHNRVNLFAYSFVGQNGHFHTRDGGKWPCAAGGYGSDLEEITQAQFIAKLREWNHPALKEFEAQPRKRVEGRVWKNGPSKNAGETKYEHWRSVLIGGRIYSRGAWNKEGVWSCESNDIHEIGLLEREFIELHGPEADAIIRECAKAMGLDHGTR